MKIAVLGNCQVHGIAHGLKCIPGADATTFEVWRLSPEQHATFEPRDWDVIVSQPLSVSYQAMSGANLRASGKPAAFIHNLYFDGLCPDASYLGPPGKRVVGPMGDYSSTLVVDAFRSGASAAEAARRLQEGHASIDPQAAWAASMAELRRREAEVDVPFADQVEASARARRSFWTFNHPDETLLTQYARQIAMRFLGVAPQAIAPPPDELRVNGVWPIYPWVREALGIEFGGETEFVSRDRVLSALEFVEWSYKVYETARDRIHIR
jgi:Polysaccharide biosynthesis enzyme WcbI